MSNPQLRPAQDATPSLERKAVLVVNTKSRRGQEWFSEAKQLLTDLGVDLVKAKAFRTVDELRAEARKAIDEKVPLVIAGGGDGTFSAIARYFVNSESTLGVLPLGTGNAFARDLNIPAEMATACETIAAGRTAEVDLGYMGDDYFLNVATIGLTTTIAQSLTVPMKRRWGRFVYAIALARGLQKVKPFRVRLETEHGVDEFETLQLVLGVGRYHAGPFPLSPNATITDGKLTLYALAATNKAAFVKLALRLPTGSQGELEEVHTQETTGGTVTTTPSLPITVDGEVCLRTPTRFSIAPRAIRVLVPQTFEG